MSIRISIDRHTKGLAVLFCFVNTTFVGYVDAQDSLFAAHGDDQTSLNYNYLADIFLVFFNSD